VTLEQLLSELRRREVTLRAHEGGLRCSAPPGVLTAGLREEILRWKPQILELLGSSETLHAAPRAIVPIETHGTRTPVFGVPGHNGDVFCYRDFARDLGAGRPFFGLEPPGLDGHSSPLQRIEDLAAFFEEQIRTFRPAGPCIVAGYCAGGTVAFELARRLAESERNVLFVALFGSPHPSWYQLPAQFSFRVRQEFGRVSKHARALWSAPSGRLRYVADNVRRFRSHRDAASAEACDPVLVRRHALEQVTVAAVRRYRIQPYRGRLLLFMPNRNWLRSSESQWRAAAAQTRAYYGPRDCRQDTMLTQHSSAFASLFRQSCEEHERSSGSEDTLVRKTS